MTDPQLETLRAQYHDKEITTEGYVLRAIDLLELTELRLDWLAEQLDIPRRTLDGTLGRLRNKGKITIQAVHPKHQVKRGK